MEMSSSEQVGPVLEAGYTSEKIVSVLKKLNRNLKVIDEGSYLRILAQDFCILKKDLVEEELGRAFEVPRDLERIMPSFKGNLRISENLITWSSRKES